MILWKKKRSGKSIAEQKIVESDGLDLMAELSEYLNVMTKAIENDKRAALRIGLLVMTSCKRIGYTTDNLYQYLTTGDTK